MKLSNSRARFNSAQLQAQPLAQLACVFCGRCTKLKTCHTQSIPWKSFQQGSLQSIETTEDIRSRTSWSSCCRWLCSWNQTDRCRCSARLERIWGLTEPWSSLTMTRPHVPPSLGRWRGRLQQSRGATQLVGYEFYQKMPFYRPPYQPSPGVCNFVQCIIYVAILIIYIYIYIYMSKRPLGYIWSSGATCIALPYIAIFVLIIALCV